MFFPIRTDRRLNHKPWVNYGLIAVNVLVYFMTAEQVAAASRGIPTPIIKYFLQPTFPHLGQFITYQFLHADVWHLLGNMLFLYVFGNNVEDRLGKVAYLFFYLAGGVIAGLGHALSEPNSVLGASGAVAGVTGAYLALFPLSNITIVYFFFFIGAFEVSGMVLILFQIGWNLLSHLIGVGQVAYLAHLSGYLYGFVVGMALLLVRVLPRESYDMLALIARQRRRGQFRRLTREGYTPWEGAAPTEPSRTPPPQPPTAAEQRLMTLRQQITAALNSHDMATASKRYQELLQEDPRQVMGQQQQLDLANQLMAEGRYDLAATAYELFLKQYTHYAQKAQIQLILGLIYARYLGRQDRAKELLTAAASRLSGTDRELARQVLSEVG